MKNYKYFLLLSIAFTLLLSSCKDKDEVGLDRPVSLLETTLIDDSEINSYSFFENTHETTDNATYALVGAYQDNFIGTLKAYHYSQLKMSSSSPNFGANFTCDSAVFFLSHAVFDDGENHSYGDTLTDMPISVWQIDEGFDSDVTYKSTDELTTSLKMGETALTYQPRPGTDQILEIPIDKTVGQDLLDKANLQSNDAFVDLFKGVKIGASDGSFGAVLGFENLSEFTKLVVYYHNDDDTELTANFVLNNSSRKFNQYIPDYSGTNLSSLTTAGDTVNSTSSSNQITIQSGTGLGALLKFPAIEKLIDTTKLLSIIQVDLIMSIEDNTTSSFIDEPNEILIAYEVENSLIKVVDDEPIKISNDGVATGTFNSSLFFYDDETKSYTLPLTGYFEKYQKGETTNLDICLQGYLKETRINRSIISNQLGSSNPLKLKFYYTILK
jgi:hypothetical protein